MTDRPIPEDADRVPLVLDMDGTLLRTDMLYETFWAALGRKPFATLRLLARHWTRPARLKHELRAIADPRIDLVPVRAQVLQLARAAQEQGRPVHLASGSDQGLVDAVGQHLDLAGPHFGSTPDRNLTGDTKAAFLVETFGKGGFDYAGNAAPDLKPWNQARRVIAVSPDRTVLQALEATGKPIQIVDDGWDRHDLFREMRPHQWIKNLLLFLPMLAAHQFQPEHVLAVLVAAPAFSLGASAIYIVNDLLDLEADRLHPSKRNRPIASGRLPIRAAMVASAGLTVAALGLAYAVRPSVAGLIAVYMTSTLIYSLWLKKLRWVDVLTLAVLFMMRVVAGALAAQITLSPWLLSVVFTVFLTLAVVKRLTELSRQPSRNHMPGRGYDRGDLPVLLKLAVVSVAASLTLFLGYSFSPNAALLYDRPWVLALAAVPMGLWLARVIRLSVQGREDYDPVVFVTHDGPGLALLSLFAGLVVLAS